MKIAYLCEFSHPSICGVWNRVYNLASEMAQRGHEVHVFSSNRIKSTKKTSVDYEFFEGIHIHRFPVKISFGENALFWKFKAELIKLHPNIIDAQVHRHPHSTITPRIAKEIGAKSILTTHAPFVEKELRGKALNTAVSFYDATLGKKVLNSYDKIIAITKWEMPFLKQNGCDMRKVKYVPNGIDSRFLKINKRGDKNNILFLGRIAPIKDLETLIKAMKLIDSKSKLILAGPCEKEYTEKLNTLIRELKLTSKVKFTGPIYNFKEKSRLIAHSGIFVLPSKREGLPQSLLEAMAAGKIVLSSSNKGGMELVKEGKNGLIFSIGDEKALADRLSYAINKFQKLDFMRKNARKVASEMTWKKIANHVEKVYKSS